MKLDQITKSLKQIICYNIKSLNIMCCCAPENIAEAFVFSTLTLGAGFRARNNLSVRSKAGC